MTKEEIESYEVIALSQNIYRNNNLLNLNCTLNLESDGYKVNAKSIIDTGASKCYISPDLIPSNT